METLLGLIGLAFFIVCVISLAAVVTWAVVRISPNPNNKKPKPVPADAEPS